MKKRNISFIYLIVGMVALFGYINLFEKWVSNLEILSGLGVIYYLMNAFMLLFIHPIICLLIWRKKSSLNASIKTVKIHFFWSLSIPITFWILIFNGYFLTV